MAFAVALVVPGSASAIEVIEEGTQAKTSSFYSDACDGAAVVSLAAPSRTIGVAPESPFTGESVRAWSNDDVYEGSARITDITVDRSGSRPVVRWTATPDAGLCDPNPIFRSGWYSADRRFRISYRERHDVRLSRRDAAGLTREALERRFPYYSYYSHSRMRCTHTSTRARCHAGFWAGDTSFAGVVKSRIAASGDHSQLVWSYRLRVVMTNEYCVYVTHGDQCRKTYRKARHRVRAPSWLL